MWKQVFFDAFFFIIRFDFIISVLRIITYGFFVLFEWMVFYVNRFSVRGK